MKVFASVVRRGIPLGLALVACAFMAVSTAASAVGPDAVLLPAMDGAAPHATVTKATAVQSGAVKPPVVSASAGAVLVKQQAKDVVAMPDERELPFSRGWMVGLLAVLVLMLFDRIRLSMKLAKLNQDAVRSSGLSAPLIRN